MDITTKMKNKTKALVLLGVIVVSAIVAILFSVPGDQGCNIYDEYMEKVYLNQNNIEQQKFNESFINDTQTSCIKENNRSYIVARYSLRYDLQAEKLVRDQEIEPNFKYEITSASRFNIDQQFNEYLNEYYRQFIKTI